MAVCTDCDQEMRTAPSCTADALLIRDERFERRRARRRDCGRDGRCGDCGIEPGGHHHLGCDLEPCPRCRGQLISCGCSWVDDDTSSLLAVRGDVVVSSGLAGLALPHGRFPFEERRAPGRHRVAALTDVVNLRAGVTSSAGYGTEVDNGTPR